MIVVTWVMTIVSVPFLYFCSGISLLCILLAFTLKAILAPLPLVVPVLSHKPAPPNACLSCIRWGWLTRLVLVPVTLLSVHCSCFVEAVVWDKIMCYCAMMSLYQPPPHITGLLLQRLSSVTQCYLCITVSPVSDSSLYPVVGQSTQVRTHTIVHANMFICCDSCILLHQ